MEHGLKDISFYVKKNNILHSCHNFPAGSRQATRGARICETSLLATRLSLMFFFSTFPSERLWIIWADNPCESCQTHED